MDGVQVTTPASRLLVIINTMMTVPADRTCEQVWRFTFDIPDDDTVMLTRCISDVYSLIKDIRDSLLKIPTIDHKLYMESFPAIERLLDPRNLGHPWQNVLSELKKPHVLQGLKFCEAELKRSLPEQVIPENDLSEYLVEVQTLLADISKDSSLPAALRSLLIEQLLSLQRSIVDYQVRGAESIRRSLELAIGALISHKTILKGQEGSRGVTRFFGVIERGAGLIENVKTITQSGFALVDAIRNGLKLLS